MHYKNGDAHGKGVGAEKGAGKGVGDVAGEIEWFLPAKEEVLETVKQFQLAQWSNKEVMKVRNIRCRKIWATATNYNMDANTMVLKVTPTI